MIPFLSAHCPQGAGTALVASPTNRPCALGVLQCGQALALCFLAKRGSASDEWRLEGESVVRVGRVARFALGELKRSVLQRLRLWHKGRRRAVTKREIVGDEPVFEGTRVSVFHVGELVKKGIPIAELREDFPRLNDEDFELAAMYHELGRPPGRSRKQVDLGRGSDR